MSNYSGTKEERAEKRREYDRKRNSDPEVKARAKAHRQTPEYKARRKAWQYNYVRTEDVKAKRRAYKTRPENKAKRRNRLLVKNFGISLEDYNTMLEYQDNVCAICHKVDPARSLAVDHDHSNGKIRGLLCRDCNQGISKFNDDTKLLENAISYLEISK